MYKYYLVDDDGIKRVTRGTSKLHIIRRVEETEEVYVITESLHIPEQQEFFVVLVSDIDSQDLLDRQYGSHLHYARGTVKDVFADIVNYFD